MAFIMQMEKIAKKVRDCARCLGVVLRIFWYNSSGKFYKTKQTGHKIYMANDKNSTEYEKTFHFLKVGCGCGCSAKVGIGI